MKKTLIAASFGLAFALPPAEAALFDFSYVASGGTLAGTVDGTLQADHNTVIVNSLLDFVAVNGVAEPSLPFLSSWDAFWSLSTSLPTLTLDGSRLDFLACTSSSCSGNGIAFGAGTNITTFSYGYDAYSYWNSVGGSGPLPYNPANWQMSAQSTVPAPATLPLLAIGGAAMAWRHRKAT